MRPNGIFKTLIGAALLIALAGCGGGGADTISGGGDGGGGGGGGGGASSSASLGWDVPTTREDGTALTDLAGYRVYYGTATGQYSYSVDVGNSTDCVIDGLTSGTTYYFVVTSYDSSGNESEPSNEISKTI